MFLSAPPKGTSGITSATQSNAPIPKIRPPQSNAEAQTLYADAFKQLNIGISLDEKAQYQQASEKYITALEMISILLRVPSYLSSPQLQNLKKHMDMFMDRLQELENLMRHGNESGEMTQSYGKSSSSGGGGGWISSLKGWFSSKDDRSSQQSVLPQQQQQQPVSQQYTTPVFNSFRKRSDISAAPRIYQQTYVKPHPATSSAVIDLTQDDPEDQLIAQVMQPKSASIHLPSSSHAKPQPNPRRPRSSDALNRSQIPAPRTATKDLLNAPELRGVDKKILSRILDDVIETCPQISFDDVGGLDYAKQILRETVIFPQLRPDLFDGLRTPTKGILLNGPPGTGKTLLARCVASNVKATFFNISSSSLVSKYHGEGEKIVKALFAAAHLLAPSVIFIDEVDSVLTARSESEHEASRRLKTQILIELDGVNSGDNEPGKHVLVMGATNRPHELDDAALRRFPKRIYIPLPDAKVRQDIIKNVLKKGKQHVKLSSHDFETLASLTDGFSGSDLNELCKEAVMQPIRELGDRILEVRASDVRPVQLKDFEKALEHTKPTANRQLVKKLEEWNRDHGSGV